MSAESRIDVIIPSWNGRRYLERCLPTLVRQDHPSFRVIVVDNGSSDGTADWIRSAFPQVACLSLPSNRGFSGGVNAAIRATRGDFVALLNNDTEVAPGWLRALEAGLDGDRAVGFCTSKIVSLDDATLMDNAGDGFGRKGISYPIGYLECDRGQYDAPRPVFGACGAACIFRREVLERIGLFDEDFFAYHEDVDLSFRAQIAGFACLYIPSAVVYHSGSATSGSKINPFTVFLSTRNNLHVLIKNLPFSLFLRYLPWLVWGQAYWFLKMAVKEGMWGPWIRGILAGLRQARRMVRKRQEVQRLATLPTDALDGLIRSSEREIRASIRAKRARWRSPTDRGRNLEIPARRGERGSGAEAWAEPAASPSQRLHWRNGRS